MRWGSLLFYFLIMLSFFAQGNMNPLSPNSSTTLLSSNFIYNPKNLGELGSRGMLPATTPSLPERPDQPECRYFMNTGTCKYGSDCKYHHPKERIAQSVPILPSLPLRPVSSSSLVYSKIHFAPNVCLRNCLGVIWNIMNVTRNNYPFIFVLFQILKCPQLASEIFSNSLVI